MGIIKVHGLAQTACTARVLACISELGIEYELVPIDFANLAHKKQPYLSLNPFGQAPALEDGDFTIFESRAITRYLARKYRGTGTDLLRLDNLIESATVDTWMEVEAQQYHHPTRTIIHEMLINPYYGKAQDEKVIEAESLKLGKVLDVYEERLSNCKYLAGEYFSMADLHHIPYTTLLMRTPRSVLVTSRPHVNAWWNDISSRPKLVETVTALQF